MKTERKKLIKVLDDLWSPTIKKRDKFRCVRCGATKKLQSAHVHSRSRYITRWDLPNGVCLCNGCHIFWAHKHPIEFAEFIKERLGDELYYNLLRTAKSGVKVDMPFLEAKYEELKKLASVFQGVENDSWQD